MVSLKDFFRRPPLTGNALRTFRLHLVYVVLDAVAGGILLNAPLVALKALEAQNWHLPLRELFSGVGMLLSLYLGCWMARRRKMPFVFIPGILAAISAILMATVSNSALWFLSLLGIGALFEIVTRPAVAAIVRANYPSEHRGHAAGELRKWASLSFVISTLTSALILQSADRYSSVAVDALPWEFLNSLSAWIVERTPQILMVIAGCLELIGFSCFRKIRVEEEPTAASRELKPEIGRSFREAWYVVARDGRYRRYLLGCFLDGFFQMLYYPLIWAFLLVDLGFGYFGCSALMHAIPALIAFLATGALGRVLDRTNPWLSWAGIRLLWGMDALLLAATPFYASVFPPALIILPLLGRVLRGAVQGGWWVMWWQIGVTHFAPPGEDTSRYAGIMVFLNGATRLIASAAGIGLAALAVPPGALLIVGGMGVILSGAYSLWQGRRERRQRLPDTIQDFERQFTQTHDIHATR
jgi:hypothetical protein